MINSAEEAIKHLKAEIMAQDWRINDRRLGMLDEAFKQLEPLFSERKSSRYIMGMAQGAMRYLKKHGERSLPDCLDFLKESLAHLVTIYERDDISPVKEVEIFNRAYARFRKLKQKIQNKS